VISCGHAQTRRGVMAEADREYDEAVRDIDDVYRFDDVYHFEDEYPFDDEYDDEDE